MDMPETELSAIKRPVWNAGRTLEAKRALKPKQIWEIRFYLNQRRRLRDRALFDLGPACGAPFGRLPERPSQPWTDAGRTPLRQSILYLSRSPPPWVLIEISAQPG